MRGAWAVLDEWVEPDRPASAYTPREGGLAVLDPPDGVFARPPAFEKLSGGLVSSRT